MTAPIVVATDLTARSDRPLDRAVMLAEQRGTRLVVVHALEEPADIDFRNARRSNGWSKTSARLSNW
jgi:nucleotide-binding universal stress UspA family protein